MDILQRDTTLCVLDTEQESDIDVTSLESTPSLSSSNRTTLYYIGFGATFAPSSFIHSPDIDIWETSAPEILSSLLETGPLPARMALLISAKWSDATEHRLLRMLRNHHSLKYVPVIVISERMHLVSAPSYIAEQADDYFPTHPDEQQLLARLHFLWQHKLAIVQAREKLNPPSRPRVKIHPLKRTVDVVLAFFALIALSPLMLLTALAIRLESKGPVIYKSRRIGSGYREFDFWKFRSMYVNADEKLQEMLAANQYGAEATFVKFSNDPRITKVGRIIRKYSIDELPQLFNILMGDMSVVGNRPLPVYEAEQLFTKEQDSCARFLAPAGLTGLWQVEKRGQSDMSAAERIELDVRYARHYNFLTDFIILLKTFTAFIQKDNV